MRCSIEMKIDLHVACVAHATVSGLSGALVVTHLQVEFTLVGTELLIGEGALVFVGHFWSQMRSVEFGMLLGLRKGGEKYEPCFK